MCHRIHLKWVMVGIWHFKSFPEKHLASEGAKKWGLEMITFQENLGLLMCGQGVRLLLARKKVEDANTILVAQKIKETWDLITKETSHAAFLSLKRENSISKLIYTSWNCPNLNFCAKSCQSRYLFWLVYYLNFWKLIKTNNVIGKIWRKNSNWGNSN